MAVISKEDLEPELKPNGTYARAFSLEDDWRERIVDSFRETLERIPADATGRVECTLKWVPEGEA